MKKGDSELRRSLFFVNKGKKLQQYEAFLPPFDRAFNTK
jgi:hypothetical protein